ncbi:hypothetical protein EOM39_04455 [Candidatus Gracilibacteria bacterium]|nr:hypothetical protein [Candidatus Gracilibacteria bacterium]
MTREIYGRQIHFRFNTIKGFPGHDVTVGIFKSLQQYIHSGSCVDKKGHIVGSWWTKKELTCID